jgi:UDP-3-O-[3-hydroxymyristoyl] glucosamine N-acyltransferase LpxD
MREFSVLRITLHETEIRRAIGLPEGGTRVVDGLASLGAMEERCLYFINRTVTDAIRESLATRRDCIVITQTGMKGHEQFGDCVVLETADPRYAIAKVLQFIVDQQRLPPWITERDVAPGAVISPLAFVDERVAIGAGAVIEPFCVVDNDVSIGSRSVLRSGVRIHSRVVIGDASVVGPHTVIGHQGFGFVRDPGGNKMRIPHLGGVVIGSNVEIGAMVTVPSGTISPTIIEDGAKIDDHVHVGHNVRIERGASVTAGTVIGGSAIIGEEAWVGINSSIRDGRRVGSRSLVGMDGSVQEDLADHGVARAPRPDVKTRLDDDGSTIGFK